MGVRETLNQNPYATTGAMIGIAVLAIIVIAWELIGSAPNNDTTSPNAPQVAATQRSVP